MAFMPSKLVQAFGETDTTAAFSFGSAAAEMSFVLDWEDVNDVESALIYILGFSEPGIFNISRDAPMSHPMFPSLYAESVGCKFRGVSSPHQVYSYAYAGARALDLKGVMPNTISKTVDSYFKFEKIFLTVNFAPRPGEWVIGDDMLDVALDYIEYAGLADNNIEPHFAEAVRFAIWTWRPATKTLEVDSASNLVFDEGPVNDPKGLRVPIPLAKIVGLAEVECQWKQVPHMYISGSDAMLLPTNIIKCLGSLNSQTFMGCARGTLLFEGAEFEPIIFPTAVSSMSESSSELTIHYNIKLKWLFRNPPLSERGDTSSNHRGHLLYPYRRDMKFYYAAPLDTAQSPFRFENHWSLFGPADSNIQDYIQ